MAHVFKVNKKGQALLESLIALAISIPLIFTLLRSFNEQINIMLVDELIEERLICELSQSKLCKQHFEQKLQLVKPKIQKSATVNLNEKVIVSVTLHSGLTIKREINLKDFRYEF